jgi:hypothetical protein
MMGGAGLWKPASIWCFEPVCELGRTLFVAQRSLAFRLRDTRNLRDLTRYRVKLVEEHNRIHNGIQKVKMRAGSWIASLATFSA